ncbi:hypothetical protein U1Q18_019137 [Sarracenia purpurea var. burkii]
MALEALSTNELLNLVIYDAISSTPYSGNDSSETSFFPEISLKPPEFCGVSISCSSMLQQHCRLVEPETIDREQNLAAQARKKRRRRQKVCKNKEEAERQRMTHITVERNRRKQMNEHLAVLRSLMPESYVQRGDQASIVGGAIEYVKELEHLWQSLKAQKLLLLLRARASNPTNTIMAAAATANATSTAAASEALLAPCAHFLEYPQTQNTRSQNTEKYASNSKAAMSDVEVTLIETHANLRILSRKSFRQLSKMVAGLQTLSLTILHLNVTTLDRLVHYSISAKVEEGCQLNSADDIAGIVHRMLRIIEEEAVLC